MAATESEQTAVVAAPEPDGMSLDGLLALFADRDAALAEAQRTLDGQRALVLQQSKALNACCHRAAPTEEHDLKEAVAATDGDLTRVVSLFRSLCHDRSAAACKVGSAIQLINVLDESESPEAVREHSRVAFTTEVVEGYEESQRRVLKSLTAYHAAMKKLAKANAGEDHLNQQIQTSTERSAEMVTLVEQYPAASSWNFVVTVGEQLNRKGKGNPLTIVGEESPTRRRFRSVMYYSEISAGHNASMCSALPLVVLPKKPFFGNGGAKMLRGLEDYFERAFVYRDLEKYWTSLPSWKSAPLQQSRAVASGVLDLTVREAVMQLDPERGQQLIHMLCPEGDAAEAESVVTGTRERAHVSDDMMAAATAKAAAIEEQRRREEEERRRAEAEAAAAAAAAAASAAAAAAEAERQAAEAERQAAEDAAAAEAERQAAEQAAVAEKAAAEQAAAAEQVEEEQRAMAAAAAAPVAVGAAGAATAEEPAPVDEPEAEAKAEAEPEETRDAAAVEPVAAAVATAAVTAGVGAATAGDEGDEVAEPAAEATETTEPTGAAAEPDADADADAAGAAGAVVGGGDDDKDAAPEADATKAEEPPQAAKDEPLPLAAVAGAAAAAASSTANTPEPEPAVVEEQEVAAPEETVITPVDLPPASPARDAMKPAEVKEGSLTFPASPPPVESSAGTSAAASPAKEDARPSASSSPVQRAIRDFNSPATHDKINAAKPTYEARPSKTSVAAQIAKRESPSHTKAAHKGVHFVASADATPSGNGSQSAAV